VRKVNLALLEDTQNAIQKLRFLKLNFMGGGF
jgi:hypothetical protein